MSRLPLPLAQLALSGMNHVLQQQTGAREQMQGHAGRHVRIVVTGPLGGSVHSDARIDESGLLSLVGEASPDAVLTLSPSVGAVFDGLRHGAAGFGSYLKIEGDVMLAAAVGQVAQSLRWNFEEDLSLVAGDVVAHRVGRMVRSLRKSTDGLRRRSGEALQRAATARDGPLASRAALAGFAAELARLSASVSRLESRAGRPQDRPTSLQERPATGRGGDLDDAGLGQA